MQLEAWRQTGSVIRSVAAETNYMQEGIGALLIPFDHWAHVNSPWLIHTKLQARWQAYLHVHAVDGDEEPRLVPGAQLGDGVSPPHVERPVRQAEALQNHLAPLDPVPPTTQSDFQEQQNRSCVSPVEEPRHG